MKQFFRVTARAVICIIAVNIFTVTSAAETVLIKLQKPAFLNSSLKKYGKLKFYNNNYFLVSVPEELPGLIDQEYKVLDKPARKSVYCLFYIRTSAELNEIKSFSTVLDWADGNALVKIESPRGEIPDNDLVLGRGINPADINNPEITKYKFKILPEELPWPGQQNISVQYKDNRMMYRFGNIEHSTITAVLNSLNITELTGYIQDLQNFRTRYAGNAKCNDARDYLVQKFSSFGLEVSTYAFRNLNTANYNVIAALPGKLSPEKVFVICAHYDSISDKYPYADAPGADDNASGVAAVLLAGKYLSTCSFAYTIRFICFSGEEQGMVGSQDYANYIYANHEQILGVLNIDMIGYWKSGVKYDLNITANRNSEQLSDYIAWINQNYIQMPIDKNINDNAWWSDHSSFWDYGYPAVELSEAYDWYSPDFNYANYHSSSDTIDKLDLDFTLKNTKVAVSALAELAGVYATGLISANPLGWVDTVKKGDLYYIRWFNVNKEQLSLYYAETLDGDRKIIATVDGNQTEYSWDTSNVAPGKYWIFLQTQSGDWDWSSGQVVILSDDFEKLAIYPNPCVNQATISGLARNTHMKIFNIAGEMVLEKSFRNQYNWSWNLVSGNYDKLASGIYTCVFDSGSGKKTIKKFAITR